MYVNNEIQIAGPIGTYRIPLNLNGSEYAIYTNDVINKHMLIALSPAQTPTHVIRHISPPAIRSSFFIKPVISMEKYVAKKPMPPPNALDIISVS